MALENVIAEQNLGVVGQQGLIEIENGEGHAVGGGSAKCSSPAAGDN